ncbi:MAG TPA: bifunctional 4-hydroxy-2-oxoglutarate aldolase/2-dehydro-3-deoxy-phosphogluconate aldolase [Rhizomicrobium sp.]|nr:bifunctional 4-hydroxy-2-oxoglutarate aldolase/2-dehydro-3-deoxy-phosphogluconate aldolase [Rhizomicrobium sp.]
MMEIAQPLRIAQVLRIAPVVPVLTIADAKSARGIAEALVAGGLPVLEVTLRTPCALDALAEMTRVPGAIVGAGTVLDPAQIEGARAAGARFLVSPGLTERVALAARAAALPLLPGVATASEIMRGLELGFDHFKFFPAEASGGPAVLRAMAGPFPNCRFCPTGGIRPDNAGAWLSLPQVLCVGGTWLVPSGASDLAAIERRARDAAAIRGSLT